jgi:hypothetical protein
MTDKLQNEKNSQPERISLAHAENEMPDVVGHYFRSEKSRLSQRGEDAASRDGKGRLSV